jgi:hypothetical protein
LPCPPDDPYSGQHNLEHQAEDLRPGWVRAGGGDGRHVESCRASGCGSSNHPDVGFSPATPYGAHLKPSPRRSTVAAIGVQPTAGPHKRRRPRSSGDTPDHQPRNKTASKVTPAAKITPAPDRRRQAVTRRARRAPVLVGSASRRGRRRWRMAVRPHPLPPPCLQPP